ncbi:MAG TPA: hypothetical protein VGO61_06990 [Steroidobacteraceae bacterium]|jgi:hypothetical protein|nr:hypothetical protein [Steroidobacteraceae bacterium]
MALTVTKRIVHPGVAEKRSDDMAHVMARDEWNYAIVDLATDAAATVSGGVPAVLGGIYVDAALSAHACPVLDGAAPVFNLPASLAAGTWIDQCRGMRFETSLVVNSNDAATGTIVVMWRPI